MPRELTRFDRDIIQDHVDADPEGRNFTVYWELDNPAQNCFAYAVNQPQAIRPMNRPELDEQYNALGYFLVGPREPLLAHDVEIYERNNVPVHAHKVKTPSQDDCESKMGYGPVISHPRGMLQSHVRGQPNTFKFGHIVARYRYNQAKLKEYMEKNYVKTSTNRLVKKKDAIRTTSGSIIHAADAEKTRSGRIIKKRRGASDTGTKTASGAHAPAYGSARPVQPVKSGGHGTAKPATAHGAAPRPATVPAGAPRPAAARAGASRPVATQVRPPVATQARPPVAARSGPARPAQTPQGGHAKTARPVAGVAGASGGHGQAQGRKSGGGLFGFGKKK